MKEKKKNATNEPTHAIRLREKDVEILEFISAYLENLVNEIRSREQIEEDFESLARERKKVGF